MVVKPARSAVAPTVPSLWYICPANSGNAAAKHVRTNVLAAIALAATGRYAVTRYVNTDVKQKKMPVPNGALARIGTIHGTLGYVVNASQYSDTGTSSAPNIAGIRLASIGGLPLWRGMSTVRLWLSNEDMLAAE